MCKCLEAGATILQPQRRFEHETYAHNPRISIVENHNKYQGEQNKRIKT